MKNSRKCMKCDKSCNSLTNLRRHLQFCHPDDSNNSNNTYSCKSCGKTFYHKNNLRFHMKLHGYNIDLTNESSTVLDMVLKNSRKCPICEYSHPPKGNLLHHLIRQHDVDLTSEDLQFASESCFYEWKTEVENVNHCKFVQRNSTKKSKLYETTNFFCHRSGFSVYKGNVEMEESKNINPYCPASIRLEKKNDGTCQVSYLKTHVGHENDLNYVESTSSDDISNESEDSTSENNNKCVEPRSTVSEEQLGLEMEGDFVPKLEPEDVLQQPSDNMNTLKSESLEDEKQELIDRITRQIRSIQSKSTLDILGKMTEKLVEVLNENNIL